MSSVVALCWVVVPGVTACMCSSNLPGDRRSTAPQYFTPFASIPSHSIIWLIHHEQERPQLSSLLEAKHGERPTMISALKASEDAVRSIACESL